MGDPGQTRSASSTLAKQRDPGQPSTRRGCLLGERDWSTPRYRQTGIGLDSPSPPDADPPPFFPQGHGIRAVNQGKPGKMVQLKTRSVKRTRNDKSRMRNDESKWMFFFLVAFVRQTATISSTGKRRRDCRGRSSKAMDSCELIISQLRGSYGASVSQL